MSKKASQSDNRRRSSYIICQNDVLVFGSQKKLMEIYETLSDIREQRDLYENDWLGWLVYSYDEGNDEVADCYAFLNEKPVLLRDGNVVECLILSIETEFVPPFKLFEWMEQTLDVDVDYSSKEPICGTFMKKNVHGHFPEEYALVMNIDGESEDECYVFNFEEDIWDCLNENLGIKSKKALAQFKKENKNAKVRIYQIQSWEE